MKILFWIVLLGVGTAWAEEIRFERADIENCVKKTTIKDKDACLAHLVETSARNTAAGSQVPAGKPAGGHVGTGSHVPATIEVLQHSQVPESVVALESSKVIGNWHVYSTTDLLYDSSILTLVLPSIEDHSHSSASGEFPILMVRCMHDEMALKVDWREAVALSASDHVNLISRVGKKQLTKKILGNMSGYQQVTGVAKKLKSPIYSLLKSEEKIFVEVESKGHIKYWTWFDPRGFNKALKEFGGHCHQSR